MSHQIKAVCVEVQETQSSTLITFSSYYDGCAPVQVVNLFPEVTLSFRQDSRLVRDRQTNKCKDQQKYYQITNQDRQK